MWLMNDLNLAQMTFPFPLKVVIALQYKWFSQGLTHSAVDWHPFSYSVLTGLSLFLEIRCCIAIDVMNGSARP